MWNVQAIGVQIHTMTAHVVVARRIGRGRRVVLR
jgi:hypothetical protein